MFTTKRNELGCGKDRHAVPFDLCGRYPWHRYTAVQAHAVVQQLPPRAPKPLRKSGSSHSVSCVFLGVLGVLGGKLIPATFDLLAASVILVSHDSTGRQRVPSRKRAEEKDPDCFGDHLDSDPGLCGLVESLLAGKARRRQIFLGVAETGL